MKKIYIFLAALFLYGAGFSQSTINITTTGGSFTGEKWVSITTGIDGSGTQIWGQGDGTQCNGSGLINQDISIAPGTYYVNCYDQYDDGWDGTTIVVTAYGSVIGNNGGASPNDGSDTDLSSACEGTPEELEASFEIIVPAPPACPDPSGLTLDSTTTTTAVISWTAGGTETDWEIVVQAPGTGEPAGSGTATTNNPYTASGLTANTAYEVYVRANCGGDFSGWIGPLDFTTACNVFSIPFNESFDSTSTSESCWTVLNENGDFDAWDTNYTSDTITGDESAALNTDFNSGNNDDWLISPTITLTGNERLKFKYSLQSPSEPNDFEVLLSTSGTAPASFTNTLIPLTSYNDVDVDNGESTELIVDISAYSGDVNIAWHVPSGGLDGWRLYIDDVVVETLPSCPDISGLTIDSVAAEEAQISWTAGGTETDWEIVVQPDGTGEPAGAGTATTNNPYTATGLTELTDYEVYVRSNCGGDFGAWIGPATFTTLALCPDISGLSIDSFTDTEVTVSWTAGDTETAWEIVVQPDNTGVPGGAGTATTNNPHTASGLTGNTAYEVYVRADCTGASNGFSQWVGPVDFTTNCSPIVPEYNADMSTHVPDACWDEAGAGDPGTGPTSVGFSNWRGGTSYAFGSSNAINLYSDFNSEWLLSPSFDLSTGGPYQLEINVAVTNWNNGSQDDTMGSDDEVQLLISTDGGTTWTNLTTWNAGNEPDFTGTEYTEDLTAYTGTVQFAVWASDGTVVDTEDYDFHVGKFRVAAIPSSATVDYCNLQFPNSGTINEGDNFTAFAQIFQTGVTEAAGQGADVEAWIGYSTTDATTVADFESPSWTWVPATYNTDSGNNDEYQAEIGSSLAGGNYYYASRFRYDGGVFAYGGITPGGSGGDFWDGTNYVSGQLDVLPPPPMVSATLNISGCNASDSFNVAYASATDDVIWVELVYDGNCSEITVDTESTTGIDTEIGLYDVFGNVITTNDDGGTGSLSLITQNLAAGTYYIAAGAYNVNFSNNFAASTSDTVDVGTLFVNASTPNQPDFVNLQFPGEATITAGGTATVFAQIFEAGNTPGAGAGTNITAEIGISAIDATTVSDFETVNWTWTAAPYFGEVGNNDEYSLDIGASLAPGTYYYVSRFSVDGGPFVYGGNTSGPPEGGNFWDGTTNVSGVLTVNPKPEPTNHVTDFTAVADSDTEITLTWTDNDGAQPADGFLIVAKTGAATFYVPVDGTDDADDTNWSDDEAEVKVASGVQTYTVTGLTASTLYDFEIYPYTNSGATIDYKTDGTIPTASATTDADPCAGVIPDYFADMSINVPDNCWNEAGSGEVADGPSGLGSSDWRDGRAYAFGPSNAINLWQAVDREWLLSPTFDLTTGGPYQLEVNVAVTNYAFSGTTLTSDTMGSDDEVQLLVSTDGGASWSNLTTWNAANQPDVAGTEYIEDLTSYTGSVQFAIWASDGTVDDTEDYDFHVGKFNVVSIPTPVTYTYDGAWSPSDPNGVANSIDDIVVTSGNALITADTNVNSVTVNPGASLTVNSGFTLTVGTDLTLESVSDNYSSLLLEGTVSGTVIYERYVNANSNGNDLVSPPLSGQTWASFLADGTNATDLLDDGLTSPTTYAFGPFDKTIEDYLNYTDATVATLQSGTGYRAATDAGTTLSFTGSVETGTVPVNIEDTGATFPDWNLVGNPYPAYMSMADFLTYDLGDGTRNVDILEALSGIYGYDGNAANGWDVVTLANAGTRDMAPGQGFFVAANDAFVAGYDLTFDPSMRRAGSGDDFILGRNSSPLTFLKLNANTANHDYTTQFYFNDNATTGLDHGYDAKLWGDVIPSFALYSNLVQDNTGFPIALQALNPTDLVDVVIPLGVNANASEQLRFTISESTLPSTINVYLDDALTNTTTLLNTSDYVINPISDITGTGRFYIRFTEQALSLDDANFDALKIYTKTTPRAVYVHGVLQGETTAKVFDLQGRLVHYSVLNSNQVVNEIDASDFSDGIYVVTLSNGVQEKTQKVIIR